MTWRARLHRWLANRFPNWFAPRALGQRGEAAAAKFLRRLGYQIVARSDRSPIGELDIVAVDQRTVVFVEVKTRESNRAGSPADAVDERKQLQLARAALAFLRSRNLLNCTARFDVIAVTWPAGASRPSIEHFKNAFEPPDMGNMF